MTSIGLTEPADASTARLMTNQYSGSSFPRHVGSCLTARTTARSTGILVDRKATSNLNSYLLDGSKYRGQALSDLLFACLHADR